MLAGAVLLAMAGCVLPCHAAERVYLRGGSNMVCDHQKKIDGNVRLFLTPGDDSYVDIAATEVVREEAVSASLETQPVPVGTPTPMPAAKLPAPVDLPVLLRQAGAEHHLDPDLLASVVRAESGGRTGAVSRTGARGLMQLMPGTAADLGVGDSFQAEQNIAAGTTYLDALLMYYHDDLALALAAYNAGPAAVNRYRGIPPYGETRRYVERVIHDYNQRKLREARQRSRRVAPGSAMAAMVARP